MSVCEFCNNTFKNDYILKTHQKQAKYCLKLQNKIIDSQYICEWCTNCYTRKYDLVRHRTTCMIKQHIEPVQESHETKIAKIIKEYEQKYKEIQLECDSLKNECVILKNERNMYKELYEENKNIVQDMAQRPTTNNTRNNNLIMMSHLDLSPERIKNIVENRFAVEHFNEGQKGVANFAVEFILKDQDGNIVYRCGDCTRQTFRYKDVYDQIVKDVKANRLTTLLAPEIKVKTKQIAKNMYNDDVGEQERVYENYNSIQKIDKDNTDFITQLTTLTA